MTATIYAIGTAQPEHFLPQERAAEMARSFIFEDERGLQAVGALLRRSGVRRRGFVVMEDGNGAGLRQTFYAPARSTDDRGPSTAVRMQRYAREAPGLAEAAARWALDASGCPAGDITHLVTVSCTGFFAPGLDFALVRRLGLRPTVGRLQIGFMGCHGALNGLLAAKALAESHAGSRVLLCAAEVCSVHFQYGLDPLQLVANTLFADGAAAAVIGPPQGAPPGSRPLLATSSFLMPDSEDAMTWQIGDHGFLMTLSAQVPQLIATHLRDWLCAWLAGHGLALNDVGSWAIHPGGPRVTRSVARALGLDRETTRASEDVLAECGNMSSPTVLFVLDRLTRAGAPAPCVLLAFGPGLVAEAAVVGRSRGPGSTRPGPLSTF